MTCPKCSKYLKAIKALITEDKEIRQVTGICKKHGVVEPKDWLWEDFFGYE